MVWEEVDAFMWKLIILMVLAMLAGCAQQVRVAPLRSDEGKLSRATLDRLILHLESSCTDVKDIYPYEQLIELREQPDKPGISYDFRLYQAFSSSDWVPLTREKSCRLALLDNMDEGIAFSLMNLPKTSFQHNTFYLELAYSKYARIALTAVSIHDEDFRDADSLIQTYIANDDGSYQPERAMPYYFAASKLTVAARLSNNPAYIKALLNRSIATANAGLSKAKNPAEILIALNGAKSYLEFYKLHMPGF